MEFNETETGHPLDEEACLVVAALADGEPVDPTALRAALDDPAVREYLVDLIALRRSVASMPELPSVQWRERRSFLSRIGWIAAAAAIAVSVTAGYVAGQRTVQAAPAPSVETVVHLESPAVAPRPTRVISLRPGINWTEKPGER